MKSKFSWLSLLALATVLVSACGPATFQRKLIVWEPFDARESRQQKDNVTLELTLITEVPSSFNVTVARCNQLGQPVLDQNGRPVAEQISPATNDQVWKKVAVTNNTENVLRLNSVVIRLFDPGANQYSALTFDDLKMELYAKRPCASTEQAMNMFRVNKIFDRNMEIVPGTTSTFYVAFKPASRLMPGIWKFALYDVPVSVDAAGRPTRTTRFETRIAVKEVTSTYTRESLLAKPVLVEQRQLSAGGESTVTTPGVVPAAAAATAPPAAQPSQAPTQAAPSPSSTSNSAAPAGSGATSAAVMAQAQTKLNALGFNVGKPDGMAGPRTRQAIQQFQRSKGLEASGQLDAQTIKALGM